MWFAESLEVSTFIDKVYGLRWVVFYSLYQGGLYSDSLIDAECILFKCNPDNFLLRDVQLEEWSVTADVGRYALYRH